MKIDFQTNCCVFILEQKLYVFLLISVCSVPSFNDGSPFAIWLFHVCSFSAILQAFFKTVQLLKHSTVWINRSSSDWPSHESTMIFVHERRADCLLHVCCSPSVMWHVAVKCAFLCICCLVSVWVCLRVKYVQMYHNVFTARTRLWGTITCSWISVLPHHATLFHMGYVASVWDGSGSILTPAFNSIFYFTHCHKWKPINSIWMEMCFSSVTFVSYMSDNKGGLHIQAWRRTRLLTSLLML